MSKQKLTDVELDDALGFGPPRDRRPFEPWLWADLEALADLGWLVGSTDQPVLLAQSLWLIFGRYKSGKTFFAMEMAFCLAFGIPFLGRPVKQTNVAYIIAEGGLKNTQKRFAALCSKYDMDPAEAMDCGKYNLITTAVNLADPEQKDIGADALIRELADIENGVGVIFLDTWMRMLAASGSHASDQECVPLAIAGCDRIREKLGCAVVLLAHVGHAKDAQERPVGMNELPGALDGGMLARKEGEGSESWFRFKTCIQRHAEDGFEVFAQMARGALVEKSAAAYRASKTKGHASVLLEAFPTGGGVVTDDAWREAVYAAGLVNAKTGEVLVKADTKLKAYNRARDGLVKTGVVIKIADGYALGDPVDGSVNDFDGVPVE